MRASRRPGGPPVALLAARARHGERRATVALRARLTPDLRQLALVLGAEPSAVAAVVRGALDDALADTTRPYPTAAVVAVQRRAADARPVTPAGEAAPDSLRSAVGVLCDLQGHSHASAAALLGQPVRTVAELHAHSRDDLGVDPRRSDCRGWPLVARLDELTPPEQAAGRAHLEGCRPCRDAVEARAAARARLQAALPIGGTAAGGVVVALLTTLGGGSMAAGAVAVGAAAVLGTAGAVVPVLPDPPAPVEQAPAPARPAGVTSEPESGSPVEPTPGTQVGPGAPASTVLPPGVPGLPGVPVVPLQDGAAPGGLVQPADVPAQPAPATTTPPPAAPEPDATVPGVPVPTAPELPELPAEPLPTLPPADELPSPSPSPTLLPLDPVSTVLDRLEQVPAPERSPEPTGDVTAEPTPELLEPVLEPVLRPLLSPQDPA